ncbi:hypothetical protein HID58_077605, partial [Brassica napus]
MDMGNVSDSRSSGIDMSIVVRSLASEDSDGLTPSAVFSQIMNPKGQFWIVYLILLLNGFKVDALSETNNHYESTKPDPLIKH